MSERKKTKYPGVFYRMSKRIGGSGTERVYYVVYKKDGKACESKAGRQFADDMTPARAAFIRAEIIENKRLTRKQKRQKEAAIKKDADSRWTVQRLFEKYTQSRPEGKSLSTDKGRYDKYLKIPFGETEPKNILALDVDRLRIRLLKIKSPQTVLHVLNLLTWVLNYGIDKGLCPGLNFKIKKPKVKNLVTEDLTDTQIQNLLAVIEADTHPQAGSIMLLALFTGMRKTEIFKLQWKHVNFERAFIEIVDSKGGGNPTIPLNDSARELLNNHHRTDSPFVFPGREGKQLKNIYQHVNRIKRKAGLPAKFRVLHGLRHVFASMLASSGKVDMYTLQKLLTHKSPLMTQRYAHLRDETLQNASNVLTSELLQKRG